MILHERDSVSTPPLHSIHDRPPQSDASKIRVLVSTHRQYISRLGPLHLSINRQSEIIRLSGERLHVSPLCLFYGTQKLRATH